MYRNSVLAGAEKSRIVGIDPTPAGQTGPPRQVRFPDSLASLAKIE
jgi:hypothetical protein